VSDDFHVTSEHGTGSGRRRDFRLFWAAHAASVTGDQICEFLVPLLAISLLHVSSTELGILGGAQWLPFLLLALPFGVVIDRHPTRLLLLASELGRGLLTLGLLAAVLAHALSFPALVGLALALGACAVVYEVGYQSAIPSLVPRARLGGANARVQATTAAAEIAGPGLGGAMLQLIGASGSLAVNGAMHLASACALARVRSRAGTPPAATRHFLTELREGAGRVLHDPLLRANVGFSALYNPFAQWVTLLLTLYAVRSLGLEPVHLGLVFSAGAAGAVVGAAAASRISRGARVGTALLACAAVECGALLSLAIVDEAWDRDLAVAALALLMAVNGTGTALSSVLLITIRQLRTPEQLLGRVNATMRTVTYGTIPLGALAGGLAGDWLGPRLGLLVGAVLGSATIAWVAASPLARIRRLSDLETVPDGG